MDLTILPFSAAGDGEKCQMLESECGEFWSFSSKYLERECGEFHLQCRPLSERECGEFW